MSVVMQRCSTPQSLRATALLNCILGHFVFWDLLSYSHCNLFLFAISVVKGGKVF